MKKKIKFEMEAEINIDNLCRQHNETHVEKLLVAHLKNINEVSIIDKCGYKVTKVRQKGRVKDE